MKSHVVEIVSSVMNDASGVAYSVKKMSESVVFAGKQALTLAVLEGASSASHDIYSQFIGGFIGPERLGFSPNMFKWLIGQVKSGSVELIHSHSLWMMPNVYPGYMTKYYHTPSLYSPRGTLSEWAFNSGSIVKKAFWPIFQKPALEAATCFHATAMMEYEDIRKMGFSQPIAIIPNGIDIPRLLDVDSSSRRRTLLFLARIHPVKGLDMLLQAWAYLRNKYPEWQLKVIGPDNRGYLSKMLNMSSQLGLERIEFAGGVYGDEKIIAYQNADIYVLPSYTENFGNTVAEALAAGTPAIVTKGAPWQGLETHNAGKWIDIGVDPLIEALESMMSLSREELDAMGMNGRAWMESEFSWSRVGAQMAETYEWMISGGRKPDWVIID